MKVRDGSLVVPARLTAGDGAVQDGVKRTDRRHPLYDAWRSYCERHPDEVVERRRRLGDTGEDLAERLAAACSGLLLIIVLAAIDGLKGAFDGVAVSAVVVLGVVAGVCFFIWGVVDSHVNDGRLLGIRRAGDRVNRGRLDPKDFYGGASRRGNRRRARARNTRAALTQRLS